MAITRSKFTRDEKVEVGGYPATVIRAQGGKVTIRNRHGYVENVKVKDVKKLN